MAQASDSEFTFRKLEATDFEKGYLETLSGLTKVGETTKTQFLGRFNEMFPRLETVHKIIVIEDIIQGKIIGTGALVVERKFTRDLGLCGHVEDIVVNPTYQGKNLGRRLIEVLKALAEVNECYKVILDCAENNVGFYNKCGFTIKES